MILFAGWAFFSEKKNNISDGSRQLDGSLFSLDGPFLVNRKIISDGAQHMGGCLFSLGGLFY